MDTKQKSQQSYIPDKQTRREKVLIGLSGIDSMVVAYLLKIQKYDLLAVTIINSWDDFTGDQEKTFSCHMTTEKVEKLKEFCHQLGIPFQAYKAGAEFREEVIESWLSDRLVGVRPKPCWSCHDFRMRFLFQKMKEAGATLMATGHYAKLFRHESHDTVFVHTSGDEQFDQSSLLSRLPHNILASLMLPLSDLTRKEVVKLAENFAISHDSHQIPMHDCLKFTPDLIETFEKKVPSSFIRDGDIMSIDNTEHFGTHLGIHRYTVGDHLEPVENRQVKGVMAGFSYSDKKIFVAPDIFFKRTKFMLVDCHFSEEVSMIEPLKGFVVFPDQSYRECWFMLKNLSAASVELLEGFEIVPGNIVTVVKKKGKNAKVFLTGVVKLLAPKEIEEEGESKSEEVDPILDF
jgi:tRNA U34 2-thiouridine synthase MnmA/TrmU